MIKNNVAYLSFLNGDDTNIYFINSSVPAPVEKEEKMDLDDNVSIFIKF